MEHEIVVFEAPVQDASIEKDTNEEIYVKLSSEYERPVITSLRNLEDKPQFDSTVPSLIAQHISGFMYPIWDRLIETNKPKSQFYIKMPLKHETVGVYEELFIAKQDSSADIIGFKGPRTKDPILLPQSGYIFRSESDALKWMSKILLILGIREEYLSLSTAKHLRSMEINKSSPSKRTIKPPASSKHVATVLDLCECSIADLNENAIISSPLDTHDSWWISLNFYHLKNIYIASITNSPQYEELLEELRERRRILSLSIHSQKLLTVYREEEAIKLSIARNRFKHTGQLSELTKSQYDIVNNEYNTYIKRGSIDPGLEKTIFGFQQAMFGPAEILRSKYAELKKKLPHGKSPDQVYQLYALCQHRVRLAELLIDGMQKHEAIDIIKAEFTTPDLIEYYGFFCNKCGELIKRLNADEMMDFIDFGDLIGGEDVEDPLYQLINKIVFNVLNNDVIFSGITKVTKIADNISAVIAPKIVEMEKILGRSKVTLVEHMKDLLSIYIHIYVMAIVIRMITLNPEAVSLVTLSMRGGRPKSLAKKTKNNSLASLIYDAREILIRNVAPHMKFVASIKKEAMVDLLVKAYSWTKTLKETKSETKEQTNRRLYDAIRNPIYVYMRNMHCIAKKGRCPDADDTKTIIGRSHEEIEAGKTLFDNLPILDNPFPPGDENKYRYQSYLEEAEYNKNGIYLLTAMPASEVDPALTAHMDKFRDLAIYDVYHTWKHVFIKLPNYWITPFDPDVRFKNEPSYKVFNYSQYYDNSGKPIKWEVFIYEDNGKEIEVPVSDIESVMKKPEFQRWRFVDWGLRNGTRYMTCSDSSVEESVKVQVGVKFFLDYYTYRCPEGDLHSFDAKGII